jgi:hypothetical protein
MKCCTLEGINFNLVHYLLNLYESNLKFFFQLSRRQNVIPNLPNEVLLEGLDVELYFPLFQYISNYELFGLQVDNGQPIIGKLIY